MSTLTGNSACASPPRLQHVYPQWEPPEDDPSAPQEEWRQVWHGRMRIIHRQRYRTLIRRGIPKSAMWMLGKPGRYAWFVELPS
jgi:hypothetical protein